MRAIIRNDLEKINACNYVDKNVKTYKDYVKQLTNGLKENGFSQESINHCLNCESCYMCEYWSEEENENGEWNEYCYLPIEIEDNND